MNLSDVAQYMKQGFFTSIITTVVVYAFEGDELDTCLDLRTHIKIKNLKLTLENLNAKKSWPAKIKRGWIPLT